MTIQRREIPCDHEYGPAFQLSAQRLCQLRTGSGVLAENRAWRSCGMVLHHQERVPRLRTSLTGIFHQRWHVTLIISRGRETTTRFGIFYRHGDIWLPCAEFTLLICLPAQSRPRQPLSRDRLLADLFRSQWNQRQPSLLPSGKRFFDCATPIPGCRCLCGGTSPG